ncbi:MAG: UDP-3-O-(3-hydroxymyristoyl)glucosamine N-acyltransferase [Deltaproteobacteria bacterium]|nr:UDP-3-O-(3-hydroxymyristoyl)glucosamine N-acyltransferase [Deltaproteobacteria bacterium]
MLGIVPRPLDALLAEAAASLASGLAAAGGGKAPRYEIRGDPGTEVGFLCAFKEKAPPGAVTFAVKAKFLADAASNGAAAVLTTPALAQGLPGPAPGAPPPPVMVITPDPRLLFVGLLELAEKAIRPSWATAEPFFKDRAGVEAAEGVVFGPGSYIGAGVKLARNVRIGPGAVVEDGVEIGEGTAVHARAVVLWRVRIGARCVIGPGAVIGWDGFGYTQAPDPETGRLIHYRNPHLGGVVIEDDVEIGANTCVDRGLIADTLIRRGSKLDNLVQVGHNCEIGRDCLLASQVGTAGHAAVSDRAFILGQAGLSHGTRVGADAIITGQTGVTGEVPAGRTAWAGTPCIPLDEELKLQALARRFLPRLRNLLDHLRKSSSFSELRDRYLGSEGRK